VPGGGPRRELTERVPAHHVGHDAGVGERVDGDQARGHQRGLVHRGRRQRRAAADEQRADVVSGRRARRLDQRARRGAVDEVARDPRRIDALAAEQERRRAHSARPPSTTTV
jgi:hypothetical protein